jgi:hypothetical protein
MDMRWPVALGTALLLTLASSLPAQDVTPGQVLPLAVRDGVCPVVLPTPRADDQYYLILGSLAQQPGPFRLTIRSETTGVPLYLPLDVAPADEPWRRRVQELNRRLTRARQHQSVPEVYLPAVVPPAQRTFHLFIKQQEFQDAAAYVEVVGKLCRVGRHCQVYVDRNYLDLTRLQPTIEDAVRTFDEEVYPRTCAELGRVVDTDRDGRFTMLFSSWLGHLSEGKVALGGLVRGSDFFRDLEAPYGNRCDMMYLNPDLQPGPHLHALLAHEYTHAVVFSEHIFGAYLAGFSHQDEESWLNEGLAHLVEDLRGHGWSNLDYRVSAFLNDPAHARLVIADYYAAGQWRLPSPRGGAYLFLRWCLQRYGPDLPRQLVQTNLAGIANLETTTRDRFADLFRQWSLAVLLSGSGLSEKEEASLCRPNLRRPLGSRLLCGPRYHEMTLAGGRAELTLAGTAVAYVLLHSPGGVRTRVTVMAENGALMQATLLRLPEATARLSLRCLPEQTPGSLRLEVTAHDSAVTLQNASWERQVPTSRAGGTSYSPDDPPGRNVRMWFGSPQLRAGETRRSAVISLPADRGEQHERVVFKICGTDSGGRCVTGWAETRNEERGVRGE